MKNGGFFQLYPLARRHCKCESYDDFKEKFPEREYSIILSPKKYGSQKVDITHDFPETPEITYPEDGAVDVSLAPTITWEALNNIDSLTISIQNELETIRVIGFTTGSE